MSAWALGLAALSPALGVAQVTGSSSASITNLQFQVNDLKPDDGQAAGFNLVHTGLQTQASVARPPVEGDGRARWSMEWLDPLSLDAGLQGVWAASDVTRHSLEVAGSASGDWANYYARAAGLIGGLGDFDAGTQIAPHTELTISFDWNVHASVSGPCSSTSTTSCQWAEALAFVDWYGDWQPPQQWQVGGRVDFTLPNPQPLDQDGTFSLIFTNNSDGWMGRNVIFDLVARGGVLPAALVPEPGRFELLALGLLALAGCHRCARRARTAA